VTVHVEVSRVTLTGQTNELQVEHGCLGWRILRGDQELTRMVWDTQEEAMTVASEWIDLHDKADALDHEAALLRGQGSKLVAYRIDSPSRASVGHLQGGGNV